MNIFVEKFKEKTIYNYWKISSKKKINNYNLILNKKINNLINYN